MIQIQAILVEHLRAGREIWLPAAGGSMWPVLADEDMLLVRGLRSTTGLKLGDIALIRVQGKLVAHFVVALDGDKVRTQGTRVAGLPTESSVADTLGIVIARRRRSVWKRIRMRVQRFVRSVAVTHSACLPMRS